MCSCVLLYCRPGVGRVFGYKDLTLSSGVWGLDGGLETGRSRGKAARPVEVLGGQG